MSAPQLLSKYSKLVHWQNGPKAYVVTHFLIIKYLKTKIRFGFISSFSFITLSVTDSFRPSAHGLSLYEFICAPALLCLEGFTSSIPSVSDILSLSSEGRDWMKILIQCCVFRGLSSSTYCMSVRLCVCSYVLQEESLQRIESCLTQWTFLNLALSIFNLSVSNPTALGGT